MAQQTHRFWSTMFSTLLALITFLIVRVDSTNTESQHQAHQLSSQLASASLYDKFLLQQRQTHQSFPLSLQQVQEKFKITKNSIIRTHDSRALGAKYLNESEMHSNEECLQWCWNVTDCNLAVFEDKSKGSCYLFNCGSSQDFKCLLTPHQQYTSSMLKDDRIPIAVTQSEQELSNLRQETETKMTRSIQQQQPETDVSPIDPNAAGSRTTSKCRHYQFECRNSSECIAIYNVCNGIPQCSDGSDEAEELQCHKSKLPSLAKFLQDDSDSAAAVASASVAAASAHAKQQQQPQLPGFTLYNQKMGSIASNEFPGDLSSPSIPKYNPALGNYNYPRSPNDQDKSGKQSPRNPDYSFGPPSASWNQYNLGNELYNSGVGKPRDPLDPKNMMDSLGSYQWPPLSNNINNGYNPLTIDDNSGRSYQPQSPPLPPNLLGMNQENAAQPKLPSFYNFQKQSPQTLTPSGSAPKSSASSTVPPTAAAAGVPSKTNAATAKVVYANIAHQSGPSASEPSRVIQAVSFLHDTATTDGRETNSAVIALTLGLAVTAILVVIVGCRMRSFRKRVALRGGGRRSLSHDADYLVNGLYL